MFARPPSVASLSSTRSSASSSSPALSASSSSVFARPPCGASLSPRASRARYFSSHPPPSLSLSQESQQSGMTKMTMSEIGSGSGSNLLLNQTVSDDDDVPFVPSLPGMHQRELACFFSHSFFCLILPSTSSSFSYSPQPLSLSLLLKILVPSFWSFFLLFCLLPCFVESRSRLFESVLTSREHSDYHGLLLSPKVARTLGVPPPVTHTHAAPSARPASSLSGTFLSTGTELDGGLLKERIELLPFLFLSDVSWFFLIVFVSLSCVIGSSFMHVSSLTTLSFVVPLSSFFLSDFRPLVLSCLCHASVHQCLSFL